MQTRFLTTKAQLTVYSKKKKNDTASIALHPYSQWLSYFCSFRCGFLTFFPAWTSFWQRSFKPIAVEIITAMNEYEWKG